MDAPLVVGIDAREADGPRADARAGSAGRARYVHELAARLPALAPDARFVLYGHARGHELPGNAVWRPVPGSGLLWHACTARAARRECSVYFSTMTYVTPQLLGSLPFVQTVFDTIAFRDDARSHGRSTQIERATMRRAVRRARRILAISAATARDLAELAPDVAGRIDVTPLAADPRFEERPPAELDSIRSQYGLPEQFVLATGTIEPRKNLERLIRAHGALPAQIRAEVPLVLAGRRGWDAEPVFAAIAARPTREVLHLDFVPDGDLAALYSAATVFCYPSLYEGFGLPLLEAMQSGVPVITSNVSSMPEVGGDAVRYVDPTDEAQIAEALAELLTDGARLAGLRRAGLEQARRFSWDETARITMAALRSA